MKKIIVTGGNGFIGTNLILELLKKKNKILNIDKISYCSNYFHLKNKNKYLKNVKLNLLNLKKLENIINKFKPDIIYHLAAETHVDGSLENPIKHYENNVKAVLNLLIALKKAKKKNNLKKRFRLIYVGTDEVYGDLPFNSKKKLNEKSHLRPNNPYSSSKAAATLLLKTWFKNFNLPIVITHSVNNFGKFQFVEKFIPRSIMTAKKNGVIEIYGEGKNIRSWIGARNHSNALVFLANKGSIGETYNIGSKYKIKNIDLAKKIKKILNKKNINAKVKFVQDRLGHDKQYSLDFKKIKRLGWVSNFDFEKELDNTISWYLKKSNLKYFKNVDFHLGRKGMI